MILQHFPPTFFPSSIYSLQFLPIPSMEYLSLRATLLFSFFECIFMLLIAYYYGKKKAKLILFSTILHTFNTDTQFVWKVLFWGYFSLACIEDQSSNLPWEQHCHCVGLFTTDTDSYLIGKIKSLFHITKMQCTIFFLLIVFSLYQHLYH